MITQIITDINDRTIKAAAECIKRGGLVAFPTETVYGLGANALDPEAAGRIYAAKGRPSDNPLIIHLASPQDAEQYCFTSDIYYKLAERFMPGPITIILPKKDCIPMTVTGGLATVAVRIPSNPIAHMLIKYSGVPIAAPSANTSGRPSPTTARHVAEDMDGRIDIIIDGGDCDIGVESTIVMPTEDGRLMLLRPGGVTLEQLNELAPVEIDKAVLGKFDGKPLAPGMKYRHYAPCAEVIILDGDEDSILDFISSLPEAEADSRALICCDEDSRLLGSANAFSMGGINDCAAQAHRLFSLLRMFDDMPQIKTVYARMPEKSGVGLAVFNRLLKAAGFNIIRL